MLDFWNDKASIASYQYHQSSQAAKLRNREFETVVQSIDGWRKDLELNSLTFFEAFARLEKTYQEFSKLQPLGMINSLNAAVLASAFNTSLDIYRQDWQEMRKAIAASTTVVNELYLHLTKNLTTKDAHKYQDVLLAIQGQLS